MTVQNKMKAYQLELSERMQNATVRHSAAVLGVEIGEDCWFVRMGEVGEVLPLAKLTPVALTQPWFLGAANVRGDLYGITDLAVFLGGIATPISIQARILLAPPQFGVNSGVLVSKMLGIRSLNDFDSVENAGTVGQFGIANRYKDKRGRYWSELNFRGLVHNRTFLQIAV